MDGGPSQTQFPLFLQKTPTSYHQNSSKNIAYSQESPPTSAVASFSSIQGSELPTSTPVPCACLASIVVNSLNGPSLMCVNTCSPSLPTPTTHMPNWIVPGSRLSRNRPLISPSLTQLCAGCVCTASLYGIPPITS